MAIGSNYPPHQIDPRKKGFDWILQYVKAAYNECELGNFGSSIYFGQARYEEIKQYALGKQPIDKYKKALGVDESDDKSWQAISWEVPSFLTKYREIAISKLFQRMYDIQCYAVDAQAKSEEDEYFNQMKVKLMMKEIASKISPEMAAEMPELMQAEGEAGDLEELEMQREFTYKHVMAMEAEMGIQLILQQNEIEKRRLRTITNLVDYGIGGYTPYIDENGQVKFREVDGQNLILSYCVKDDFSDLTHWGEVIEVRVADLAPYFSKEEMDDICKNVAGRYGNPRLFTPIVGPFNREWNRFKVHVLDFRLLTWNESVYKSEIDGRGNLRFGKTEYENRKYATQTTQAEGDSSDFMEDGQKGSATPKYISRVKEVVYKTKWLIGTDYMYDYGPSENQIRKKSSWWNTSLDICLFSWNFHKMSWGGLTERLIPLEDKACLLWFRLQNLANKVVPYIMDIDLNQLEGIDFGSGGEKMKPSEVLNFMFSNFTVPYRSTDLLRQNPNAKVVNIQDTGALTMFNQLYNELNDTIQRMQQISGLNDATDGSNINPRNLNSTNAAMVESTNNALFLIGNADKHLMCKLSELIVGKIQIAVLMGKVSGYVKALGQQTVKFWEINPNVSIHELGIFIDEAPTREEREMLWADVNLKASQGLLSPADKAMVMGCRNLKMAAMLLDKKIRDRQEQMQQAELEKIQANSASQTEMQLQIEQMKQQTMMMEHQMLMERLNAQMMWQYKIDEMKKMADNMEGKQQADAKVISNEIMANAKILSSQIAASKKEESKKTA